MDEGQKRSKCDSLREEFEKVMIDEEKLIKEVMRTKPSD